MRVLYQRAHVKESKLVNRIWKKNARNCTNDEERATLSKQITDLESRLAFYRNEKVKNSWNGEYRVAQETETQVHLEAYAKMACQLACRKFFAGPLPREVRDMVYESIIGDSEVTLDSDLIKHIRSHSSPVNWEDYTMDPWCWSEEFMGPQVLGEYLERWFAVTEFTIKMEELNLIPDLVKCPRPTLNIDPGALISSIVIVLEYWSSNTLAKILSVEFDYLLKFQNRMHVQLQMNVPGRPIRELGDSNIEEFVASISPMFATLHQLKEHGSHIEVTLDEECHIDSESTELSQEGWVKRIKESREVCAKCRDAQYGCREANKIIVL
jgi:hypothetical protein